MIIDSSGRIISCDSGKAYRNIGISDNVYEFYVKNGEVSEKIWRKQKAIYRTKKQEFLCLRIRTK